MSWTEVSIGELADIKHGFAFKGQDFTDSGEYIVITPGNCHPRGGFRCKGEKEKRYQGKIPEGYLLKKGDLLVVLTDLVNSAPVLGGSFLIPEDNKYLHNQRLGLVEIKDPDKTSKRFISYLFNTHEYRGQVRGSASGATVRHTSPGRVAACKVRVPSDLRTQEQIANTLSVYDDLIENNNRRIELLEAAARQLYKEWFVRFLFPGHEKTKIVNGLPQGWEVVPLEEVADIVMGQSPKSEFYNRDAEGLPFHQGVTNYGQRFVDHQTWCSKTTRIAEYGDILFSVRAPVGRINITLDKVILGRGLAAIRSRSGSQSFLFYHLKQIFFKEDMIGEGSIYASISKKDLHGFELLRPPTALVNDYEERSVDIDRQIETLHRSNQRLEQARDLLLPKLMSGEIKV